MASLLGLMEHSLPRDYKNIHVCCLRVNECGNIPYVPPTRPPILGLDTLSVRQPQGSAAKSNIWTQLHAGESCTGGDSFCKDAHSLWARAVGMSVWSTCQTKPQGDYPPWNFPLINDLGPPGSHPSSVYVDIQLRKGTVFPETVQHGQYFWDIQL